MNYLLILGVLFLLAAVWQYVIHYKSANGDVNQRIQSIQAQQGTDMGLISSKYQTRKSISNAARDSALTRQLETTYDLDILPERLDRQEQRAIVLHENVLITTQEANRNKITVGTYESLKLREGVVQLELLKAQGLKDIDWEYLEREHNLQLKGAMLLAIKRQTELEGLMNLFEAIARKMHQIETGNDPPEIKTRLLPRLTKNLQIVSEAMDGENRLLQEMDGEIAEGAFSPSQA